MRLPTISRPIKTAPDPKTTILRTKLCPPYYFQPVQVRHQRLGHPDRAVSLLVVLQHGDQRSTGGDRSAVERVRVHGAAASAHPDSQPPRLKIGAVAAGLSLPVR